MKKPWVVPVLLAATAALLVVFLPVGAIADAVQSVLITNWPDHWTVRGTVSVEGPVKHAKLAAIREIVVPPVSPKETVRLVQGGTVTVTGSGDDWKFNDANLICGGIKTANATVYLIDGVLLPPQQ